MCCPLEPGKIRGSRAASFQPSFQWKLTVINVPFIFREHEPLSREFRPLITLRHYRSKFASQANNETGSTSAPYPVIVIEEMNFVGSADSVFTTGESIIRLQDAIGDQARSSFSESPSKPTSWAGLDSSRSTTATAGPDPFLRSKPKPAREESKKKLPVPTPLPHAGGNESSLAKTWPWEKITEEMWIIPDKTKFLLANIGFGNPPSDITYKPEPKTVFPKLGLSKPEPNSPPRRSSSPKLAIPINLPQRQRNVEPDPDISERSDDSDRPVDGWDATDDEKERAIETEETSDGETDVEKFVDATLSSRASQDSDNNDPQNKDDNKPQDRRVDTPMDIVEDDSFAPDFPPPQAIADQPDTAELSAGDGDLGYASGASSHPPKVLVPASNPSQLRSQKYPALSSQNPEESAISVAGIASRHDSPRVIQSRESHQILESFLESSLSLKVDRRHSSSGTSARSSNRNAKCRDVEMQDAEEDEDVEMEVTESRIELENGPEQSANTPLSSFSPLDEQPKTSPPPGTSPSPPISPVRSAKARRNRPLASKPQDEDNDAVTAQHSSVSPSRYTTSISANSVSPTKQYRGSQSAGLSLQHEQIPIPRIQLSSSTREEIEVRPHALKHSDRKVSGVRSDAKGSQASFRTDKSLDTVRTPQATPTPHDSRKRSDGADTPEIAGDSPYPALGELGISSIRTSKKARLATHSSPMMPDHPHLMHFSAQSQQSLAFSTPRQGSSLAPSTSDERYSDGPTTPASSISKPSKKSSNGKLKARASLPLSLPRWAKPIANPSSVAVASSHDPKVWVAPSFQVKAEYMSQKLDMPVASSSKDKMPRPRERQAVVSNSKQTDITRVSDSTVLKEEFASQKQQIALAPLEEEHSQPDPEAILGGWHKVKLTVPAHIPGHADLYTYRDLDRILKLIREEERCNEEAL
ncbi:hypothetical protein FRB94_001623 [Tulasnella sp. JGI-2019a]|nr:hypothetical protein FRB94_001623 [Tulasnella sp. JGI-2019a]KAG9036853.1 hypothetical protein FRB95_007698 [Tulasnella sp. JGI-2019a]